ncbi:hypothetical protein ACIRNI_27610 [Streptomyces sp. NPDC093546]|uniref:hypothetical protein n=1 Tax=Streptomyces sp. NPDC093546 TaxID=3366040 RepID=UPI003827DF17
MMKDATLKAVATTQVYIGHWANTRVEKMKARRDRGQGAIEYVGITILVVAIVVAVMNTKMGETIAGKFREKINEVLNNGG